MLNSCASARFHCFFALFLEFLVLEHVIDSLIWCFSCLLVVLVLERLRVFCKILRWLGFSACIGGCIRASEEIVKETAFFFLGLCGMVGRNIVSGRMMSWSMMSMSCFVLFSLWVFCFRLIFFNPEDVLEQMSFFRFPLSFRPIVLLGWIFGNLCLAFVADRAFLYLFLLFFFLGSLLLLNSF